MPTANAHAEYAIVVVNCHNQVSRVARCAKRQLSLTFRTYFEMESQIKNSKKCKIPIHREHLESLSKEVCYT